jgi:hypothetical protein
VNTGKPDRGDSMGSTCGQQVPDTVSDDNAVKDRSPQPLCRSQKKIGVRFGTLHLIAGYDRHSGVDFEHCKRGTGALQHPAGSNGIRYLGFG